MPQFRPMGTTDRDKPEVDRLAPARGIMFAVVLGLLFWAGFAVIVYLVFR